MNAASSTTKSEGEKPRVVCSTAATASMTEPFPSSRPVSLSATAPWGSPAFLQNSFATLKRRLACLSAGDGDGSVGNKERNRCCLARFPTLKADLPWMVCGQYLHLRCTAIHPDA